uniref:Ankyrin repeat and SOCS box containing 15 n=1 Tax=Sinocyclocheilus anshuiensis TaxID=1608454 RepID=A0A671T0H5_9TELE
MKQPKWVDLNSAGKSVLMDAAVSGNPDYVDLIVHGASPNLASLTGHLPIHHAAYEALKYFTSKTTLIESGQSPVHSAADGGHAQCLQLLIDRCFDVNALLNQTISDNYSDMRRSALYFAISNVDVTCTEMLLNNAGAKPDLDPLHCLLVAVRAGRYEIVRILLASQADVNCYFTEVTVFPTALQYCLRDEMMMRLLLNNGYDVDECFHCHHDFHFNMSMNVCSMNEIPTHYNCHVLTIMLPTAPVVSLHCHSQLLSHGLMG